jgi:hypothetical protein
MGQTVDPVGWIVHRSGQAVHRSQAALCQERSETLETRETSQEDDSHSYTQASPGITAIRKLGEARS